MEDIPFKNGTEFTLSSPILGHASFITGGNRLVGFGTHQSHLQDFEEL